MSEPMTLQRIALLRERCHRASLYLNSAMNQVHRFQKEHDSAKLDSEELQQVEATIAAITNRVHGDAIESLRRILNYGIQYAYRQDVSITVDDGLRGTTPTLRISVSDGSVDALDPRDSHGGGLAQIVGFLSRTAFISTLGFRRVLVMDEPFSAVSEEFLEPLSELLQSIVTDLGFQIILVTHQTSLAEAADRVYRVTGKGEMSLVRGS